MRPLQPAPFLLLAGLLLFPAAHRAPAQVPAPPVLTPAGDLRMGYFSSQRLERTPGEVTETDDFRVRLRYGTGIRITNTVSARVRAAGRFSTNQDRFSLLLRDHAASPEGLRLGQATLDEAYLQYRPSSRVTLRGGRMQTKFALADLMGKSLDRIDSPNTEVSWTDGAHLIVLVGGGWNTHLIAQHNSPQGPTNPLRSPLRLGEDRSRVSFFGALENSTAWGPIVQRSVDVTYVPAALPTAGASGPTEDYLAGVVRGWAVWPLGGEGRRLGLGGEVGYAPHTPTRESQRLGPPGSGQVGGLALQLGTTVSNILPRHQVGLVYGHTEAGWLIAPDFRNNDRLLELRYKWDFARNRNVDARIRRRQDLEQHVTPGVRRRQDTDFYLRLNFRF